MRSPGAEAQRAKWEMRMRAVLAPHQATFSAAGVDDVSAVDLLCNANDLINRSPVEAVAFLVRQHAIDLDELREAVLHPRVQSKKVMNG